MDFERISYSGVFSVLLVVRYVHRVALRGDDVSIFVIGQHDSELLALIEVEDGSTTWRGKTLREGHRLVDLRDLAMDLSTLAVDKLNGAYNSLG